MFFQSVKMAWSSVISNKMRSFLTMLGIIIGVVALVVLVSIANGATSQVTDIISSMGTNMLTVTITDDKENPLKLSEIQEISEIEGIAEAAASASDNQYMTYGREGERASLTGTTAAYMEIQGIELTAGRWLKTADVDNHTNVIVVNEDVAKDLLGVRNTLDAVGMNVNLKGIPFTIVGVTGGESTGMFSMSSYEGYIPYTTLMRLSSSVSDVTTFSCRAESDDVLSEAESNLNKWLLNRFAEDEDAFSIMNMSTIADAMDSAMNAMSIMLGGIAAISLLVGGIGIMNIMLVSVTERTREIGIRKAIGAGEGSILFQFLVEALMLSLIGDAFGVFCSWLILRLISQFSDFDASLNPTVVTVATVFSLAIGLIFGIYPARKAAKKNPIDALHAM